MPCEKFGSDGRASEGARTEHSIGTDIILTALNKRMVFIYDKTKCRCASRKLLYSNLYSI